MLDTRSSDWWVIRSRSAVRESSEVPHEAIGQSILRAREKIERRLLRRSASDGPCSLSEFFDLLSRRIMRNEFLFGLARGLFGERSRNVNMSRSPKISRKKIGQNDLLSPKGETVSPREREGGSSGASCEGPVAVKVETDTQGKHSRSFRRPLERSVNVAGYYLSFARERNVCSFD